MEYSIHHTFVESLPFSKNVDQGYVYEEYIELYAGELTSSTIMNFSYVDFLLYFP
ncbi:hypothetical protein D3C75_663860 [compost metagenome]